MHHAREVRSVLAQRAGTAGTKDKTTQGKQTTSMQEKLYNGRTCSVMASVVYIEVSSLGRVVCVGLEGPSVEGGEGSGGSSLADSGAWDPGVTGTGEGGYVSSSTGLVGSGGGLFVSSASSSSSTSISPFSGVRVGPEPPSGVVFSRTETFGVVSLRTVSIDSP